MSGCFPILPETRKTENPTPTPPPSPLRPDVDLVFAAGRSAPGPDASARGVGEGFRYAEFGGRGCCFGHEVLAFRALPMLEKMKCLYSLKPADYIH